MIAIHRSKPEDILAQNLATEKLLNFNAAYEQSQFFLRIIKQSSKYLLLPGKDYDQVELGNIFIKDHDQNTDSSKSIDTMKQDEHQVSSSQNVHPTKVNNIFDEFEKEQDKKYSKQNMTLANMVSTYQSNFRKLIAKINYLYITDDGRDKN